MITEEELEILLLNDAKERMPNVTLDTDIIATMENEVKEDCIGYVTRLSKYFNLPRNTRLLFFGCKTIKDVKNLLLKILNG